MQNNEERDGFLDKEMEDLNKLLTQANELVSQMGGNPMNILEQRFGEILKHQNPDTVPENVFKKTPSHTILHCVNKSTNPLPRFEKDGDSGFDLRANLENAVLIKPMTMGVIPTGLYFEVENGYEIQIRSRSGLAKNSQLFVLNQPGTVDSGYRGEILVMLFNLSQNDIQIVNGDRVAQGVVCPVMGSGKLTILKAETLTNSERGAGGFGHTGVK
jgi:dUTP pyrophosphatase